MAAQRAHGARTEARVFAMDRIGAGTDRSTRDLDAHHRRSRLLAELVYELLPRHFGLCCRYDYRHSVWLAVGSQPHGVRHRLSAVRGAATDSTLGVGAGIDHFLA